MPLAEPGCIDDGPQHKRVPLRSGIGSSRLAACAPADMPAAASRAATAAPRVGAGADRSRLRVDDRLGAPVNSTSSSSRSNTISARRRKEQVDKPIARELVNEIGFHKELVARLFGVSLATIYRWLDPEYEDRSRVAQRARDRQRRAGL